MLQPLPVQSSLSLSVRILFPPFYLLLSSCNSERLRLGMHIYYAKVANLSGAGHEKLFCFRIEFRNKQIRDIQDRFHAC